MGHLASTAGVEVGSRIHQLKEIVDLDLNKIKISDKSLIKLEKSIALLTNSLYAEEGTVLSIKKFIFRFHSSCKTNYL